MERIDFINKYRRSIRNDEIANNIYNLLNSLPKKYDVFNKIIITPPSILSDLPPELEKITIAAKLDNYDLSLVLPYKNLTNEEILANKSLRTFKLGNEKREFDITINYDINKGYGKLNVIPVKNNRKLNQKIDNLNNKINDLEQVKNKIQTITNSNRISDDLINQILSLSKDLKDENLEFEGIEDIRKQVKMFLDTVPDFARNYKNLKDYYMNNVPFNGDINFKIKQTRDMLENLRLIDIKRYASDLDEMSKIQSKRNSIL